MQPPAGVFALTPDLCQQLLAMPLTFEERSDVIHALPKFATLRHSCVINAQIENAPKPNWLRSV